MKKSLWIILCLLAAIPFVGGFLGYAHKHHTLFWRIVPEKIPLADASTPFDPMRLLDKIDKGVSLMSVGADPNLDRIIARFRAKIPAYRALFTESFANCRGMKIDFILQVHQVDEGMKDSPLVSGGRDLGADPLKALANIRKESQTWIIDHILGSGYDFILIEGMHTDGGPEAFVEDYADLAREYPFMIGPRTVAAFRDKNVDFRRYIENAMMDQGIESAIQRRVIDGYSGRYYGGEDIDLNILEVYLGRFMSQARMSPKDMETILHTFGRLRSEYAIAKAIAVMRKTGLQRGAIIFGSAHRFDFTYFASRLGLDSSMWDSYPELGDTLKNPWKEQ